MQSELLKQKKRILKKIGKEDYLALIKYIEEIYLAEYDLKILMARKASTLFSALLPLTLAENGGRVKRLYKERYEGEDEPLIISNRALVMLKKAIQDGQYKRILLIDDIIIHGRTLDDIYKLIKSWLGEEENYRIKVYALAESENGVIQNKEFQADKETKRVCGTGQWRALSNEIVNIFYLTGETYTSYVPAFRIPADSEYGRILANELYSGGLFAEQTNRDMHVNFTKSFVHVSDEEFRFGLNCSMRVYEMASQEYVLVPMVMVKPMEKADLTACMTILKDLCSKEYWHALELVSEEEIVYRTFIYIMSVVWGGIFLEETLNIPFREVQRDVRKEHLHFSREVLKTDIQKGMSLQKWKELWHNVNNSFKESDGIESVIEGEPDFIELKETFDNNIKVFQENNISLDSENTKRLMGRFLYLNGNLDEKRCGESESDKRLLGYPLYKLAAELKKTGQEWVNAVLYAIDYGKGSIVSRTKEYNGKQYFYSVIHAGEQNYKYFENEYFPYLYGLYHLEYTAREQKQEEHLNKWKGKFIDQFTHLWKKAGNIVLAEDLTELKEMKIIKEWGAAVVDASWKYLTDKYLRCAIDIAKEITLTDE